MNEVTKVSNDIKTKLWIERIQSCKTSGMTVRKWCEENKICEQTYYKWLKKLKTIAIENNLVEVPRFVPVPADSVISSKKEMIIITKGDIHIEVPDNIEETILLGMVKSLLC